MITRFKIEDLIKAVSALAECHAGEFCKASWIDCKKKGKCGMCKMFGKWDTLRVAADQLKNQNETIQRLEAENAELRSQISINDK